MNNPRRMSGLDAGFLSLELPEQPMQSMAVAVLCPAKDDSGRPIPITLDDVRQHLARRLDTLPAFRLRIKPVLFGLHHPVFVEVSDLNIDDHLGLATLPPPGRPQELDQLVASLAESRLDRQRLLWHLTLIDGLDGGRQAFVLQVHHCLMDGAALLTTLSCLFSGQDSPRPDRAYGWASDRVPGQWRLVFDAITDHGRGLARLPALARKTKRGMGAMRDASAGSPIPIPRPGRDTPLCSLNAGFTPERRFARASLPLPDVQLVKKIAGATVNDIVLSAVAGALRDYLQQRHDLPDRPLLANVPVGMEAPGDTPCAMGNRLSRLVTSLATDVADPWARLQAISRVTRESKRRLDLMGRTVVGEWLDLAPSAVLAFAVRRAHRRRRRHPNHLDTNVTVSNLRGPTQPWSFGSAVIEEMYLTAPPNSGVGVTFAVWDYAGDLLIGILSFADSVEDPAELAAGLSRSLRELVEGALRRRGESASLAIVPVGGQS